MLQEQYENFEEKDNLSELNTIEIIWILEIIDRHLID